MQQTNSTIICYYYGNKRIAHICKAKYFKVFLAHNIANSANLQSYIIAET